MDETGQLVAQPIGTAIYTADDPLDDTSPAAFDDERSLIDVMTGWYPWDEDPTNE